MWREKKIVNKRLKRGKKRKREKERFPRGVGSFSVGACGLWVWEVCFWTTGSGRVVSLTRDQGSAIPGANSEKIY